MSQRSVKRAVRSKGRKQTAATGKKQFKPRPFFKREAEWMSWMNIAPFGIGVVLALVFWFTR